MENDKLAKYNIPSGLIYFAIPEYTGKEISLIPVAKNAESSKKRWVENRTTYCSIPPDPKRGSVTTAEKIISENKFRVKVVKSESFHSYVGTGGNRMTYVQILNPDLDSRYTYFLAIPEFRLCELLYYADIISGEFQVTFAIEIKGKESFNLIPLNDDNYKKSAEVGVLLSSGAKKTTKWIPGHRYLLEGRSEYIYLGEFYCHSSWKSCVGSYYNNLESIKRELCVNLNDFVYNNFVELPQALPQPGEKLSKYFERIVQDMLNNNLSGNNVLTGYAKCPAAIDLGEVVIRDTIDINSIREKIIISNEKYLLTEENRGMRSYIRMSEILGISEDGTFVIPGYEGTMLKLIDLAAKYQLNRNYSYRKDQLAKNPAMIKLYKEFGLSEEDIKKRLEIAAQNTNSRC